MSEQASSTKVTNTSRSDPGWKYCTPVEGGTNRVRCNFCDKIMTAGITRGKEHLMGKRGKVAPCKKCPPDVKEELWKLFRERTEGGNAEMKRAADIDLGGLGFNDEDEEELQAAGGSTNTSRSAMQSKLKGPMDLFCRKPETTDKKRQLNIREAVDKEATARVHQYIAWFWYQAGLSFNLVKLKSFQDTRFATSFLSLERIHQEKGNIRKMFTSEEWVGNKLSKEAKGREATKTALMPSFWRSVVFTLKVMAPLVRVLRLVDGDKKPAMGYIYEAMDKAKETIEKSFNKVETKYKDVFSIIDDRWNCQLHRPLHAAAHFLNPDIFYDNMRRIEFDFEVTKGLYDCIERLVIGKEATETVFSELNIYKLKQGLFGREIAERQRKTIAPAQWWRMYGHSAPNLQQLAIKILGLTCSASGCERNWSVFEQIHSKKRNRLEHQKLNDLVYVKYNQKLRERHEKRSDLDPISLDDIDDCNEWLVGEMDEDKGERGDRVFDDDTLDWDTVFEASGVGEPRTYTRSNKKKRKEPSTSDTRGKAKKNISLVDEDEDEDDDIEEENAHQDDEPSEEEEGEGYASFDDNEEDEDYVEANLDD